MGRKLAVSLPSGGNEVNCSISKEMHNKMFLLRNQVSPPCVKMSVIKILIATCQMPRLLDIFKILCFELLASLFYKGNYFSSISLLYFIFYSMLTI